MSLSFEIGATPIKYKTLAKLESCTNAAKADQRFIDKLAYVPTREEVGQIAEAVNAALASDGNIEIKTGIKVAAGTKSLPFLNFSPEQKFVVKPDIKKSPLYSSKNSDIPSSMGPNLFSSDAFNIGDTPRANLFQGSYEDVREMLASLMEFRRENEGSIVEIIRKSMDTVVDALAYNGTVTLLKKVLGAKGSLESKGLGLVSFCQTWDLADDKPNFSLASPHFQTRVIIKNAQKFFEFCKHPQNNIADNSISNYTENMKQLTGSFAGNYTKKFVNLDRLWEEWVPEKNLVVFMDPGPDLDDVKTLMMLARYQARKEVNVRAIVCSGGGDNLKKLGENPPTRVALAEVVLKRLGVKMPVYEGSPTAPFALPGQRDVNNPQVYSEMNPYSYQIEGFNEEFNKKKVNNKWNVQVWRQVFKEKTAVQIQGPYTDFASVLEDAKNNTKFADILKENVTVVSCQGGAAMHDGKITAATDSFNNALDLNSSNAVMRWCFAKGIQLNLMEKTYVPSVKLDMNYPASEIMQYMHTMQREGLVGLWPSGKMPIKVFIKKFAGNDKSLLYLYENFEGYGKIEHLLSKKSDQMNDDDKKSLSEFNQKFTASVEIESYLTGAINPYDVAALLTVMRADHAEKYVNMTVNMPNTIKAWMCDDSEKEKRPHADHISNLAKIVTDELKATYEWVVPKDKGQLLNRKI